MIRDSRAPGGTGYDTFGQRTSMVTPKANAETTAGLVAAGAKATPKRTVNQSDRSYL